MTISTASERQVRTALQSLREASSPRPAEHRLGPATVTPLPRAHRTEPDAW